ncbi:MAG: 4-hydroxythreonine-4-phosphate dehydrogenase PdxA [Verrucomicrobiota bacterium]
MKGTIGITPGDQAGIGPEIIRQALDSGKLHPGFNYRILGSPADCTPGHPTPATAQAAWDALEESARLALSGEIAAVVTGPIHKYKMQSIGFDFPGQTEFFATRCHEENYAMLLTGGTLTVALVTAHVPLRDVPGLMNEPEIIRVGNLLADFLTLRLERAPRIAVAGLNPHAGESGALGREEIEIIEPAVAKLNHPSPSSIHHSPSFHGPFPPDTVFNRAAAGEFDGVLCMYHDQGLIPLKLHAFDQGVNVTIGLPVIRTSPDHGTAFEIAGKNIARPDSMIAAINLAAELAKKRQAIRVP